MNHNLKTLDDLDVNNKKVLLRVDFNVPMKNGQVDNNERIIRTLPTIQELIKKHAKIIIISHLGRPKGTGFENEFSLKPVAEELSRLLGKHVYFANDCIGVLAEKAVSELGSGEVLMLENLRFHKGETNNDIGFAKQLASLGDVFINDAFSTAHRAHASTEGVTHLLTSAAGRLIEAEVSALNKVLQYPEKPVVAIVGGAKVSTKLSVLHNLVKKVNTIIIGGGMGNTFLYAQGVDVQKSLYEPLMKDECLTILKEAKSNNCEIVLPVDAQMAKELKENTTVIIGSNKEVPKDYELLDAGPKSIEKFKHILDNAKTLLWNGPLGAFEIPPFNKATLEIAIHAAKLTKEGKLTSLAGGGDTIAAIQKANVYKDFTYISTAGGAFLEWIEGKELPGIVALRK